MIETDIQKHPRALTLYDSASVRTTVASVLFESSQPGLERKINGL
jgi:hypothetical protein